jgi:hypothetical protein
MWLVQLWYAKKKKKSSWSGKAGYQLRIKSRTMVENAKKFFGHHHTLHEQLSL